jgi:hypothetical protein
MKYMKKLGVVLLVICLTLTTFSTAVFAAYGSDNGDRAVAFLIGTDIGPQLFSARHYYRFGETYTQGGSYIRYTRHTSASWCVGWSGWQFEDILVYNAHLANFYDSNGNYIKSANIIRDTDMIYDPDWEGYESATGTDIATVNTSTSTAKATFPIHCTNAMHGVSAYDASIYCTN